MGKTAIEAKRGTMFLMDPEALVLVTEKEHPLYDERVHWPVSEKMVRSIIAKGVLQTLLVRKAGDQVEVVAGRQRTKAAREANRRLVEQGEDPIKVPVVIRAEAEDHEYASTAVTENEIRVADSVIEKAKKAARLRNLGSSDEEIAEAFGLDGPRSVQRWFDILSLDTKVKKAIEDGSVSAADALRELKTLTHEEQRAKLETLVTTSPQARRKERREAGEAAPPRGPSPMKRARTIFRNKGTRDVMSPRENLLLEYIFGEADDEALARGFPNLAEALAVAAAGKKKGGANK